MTRKEQAMMRFKEGYNCSQAVVGAFSDICGLDPKTAMRLASSFGGGMGRLREVCGAVSGMFMVAGLLYGYEQPKDLIGKKIHYERIQTLAAEFLKTNPSIVCRELLGLKTKGADDPIPAVRTENYYKKRPCVQLIGCAAEILDNYIKDHPLPQKEGNR